MNKNKLNQAFLLFIIFCTPLYLIKIATFNVPSNFLELLIVLFVIYNITLNQKITKRLQEIPSAITFSILLLLLGIFSSILFNSNTKAGLGILKSWFIIPILFSFIVYTLIRTREDIEKIFLSAYFSTTTVATLALAQKIMGVVTYDNRLSSIYASPNYLAMYLASGIFIGVYFLKNSLLLSGLSRKTYFYSTLILINILSIYFTYSYGTWLAIIASFSITILITNSNTKRIFYLSLSTIILISTLFFLQINSTKFSNIQNNYSRSSIASRIMIWKSAGLMIEKYPIFGIGAGNFQDKYLELQPHFPPYLEWAVPAPHNIFLAFWLQGGLIGLISFCYIISYVIKELLMLLKNKKSVALATPIFSFFIYMILHGLIDTTYWKNDLSILFWIYFFAVMAMVKIQQKEI